MLPQNSWWFTVVNSIRSLITNHQCVMQSENMIFFEVDNSRTDILSGANELDYPDIDLKDAEKSRVKVSPVESLQAKGVG